MKVIKFLLLVLTIAVAVIVLVFFATQYAKFDKNDNSSNESSEISLENSEESSEDSESSEEPTPTPKPTTTPTPSPTVKPEVTASPKPTPSPSPSPTATSSKDESSDDYHEDDEEEISIYSMPIVGESEKFKNEFKNNEIDTTYMDDMFIASSTYIMKKTVSDAVENWQFQINSSLNELKITLSSNEYQKAKDDYDEWVNDLPSEKQAIYDKYADSGSFGIIDADYEIMLLYREKAADLKELIYNETGKLEFKDPSTAMG